MIHTVKGFGIVNKAEVDVFLELFCFFHDPTDVGNSISGSPTFSKSSLNIWKFTAHILLKPGLESFEHYFGSMWDKYCALHYAGRISWDNTVKCTVYYPPMPKLHCQQRPQVHPAGEDKEAFLEKVAPLMRCVSCQHLYRPSSRWAHRCQIEKGAFVSFSEERRKTSKEKQRSASPALNGSPLQYSCLKIPWTGQPGYSPWGCKESDMI